MLKKERYINAVCDYFLYQVHGLDNGGSVLF